MEWINPFTTEASFYLLCHSIQHIKTGFSGERVKLYVTIIFNPYNAELILYKLWTPKGLFQFEIIIICLSWLFLVHLNICVMGSQIL